ncbi:MAG TPA: SUMF1/EgtB/PvdO family nonheme iron enzyme [Anaerolineae bacterium]|nr:SUMF1/EgtB/PvdO family nonheme iron enzyme [Anaerolineae bacterium]
MKRLLLLLSVVVLGIGTGGCGPQTTTTQGTVAIQDTQALPEPTAPAAPSSAPFPTQEPTAGQPPASPMPEPMLVAPPTAASLGEPWVRPVDGMVMVYVPGGEFEMGSNDPFYNNERPPHAVALDGFWMDQTEVTNAQYRACVAAGACKTPSDTNSFTYPDYYDDLAYNDYPVIYVNWYRAVAYCQWVGGRLPTEEEWEYAARGPEGRWYPWGDMPDRTRLNFCDSNCPLAHADQAVDDGYPGTAPVGSYPAGASWCGALDMVGNAWEWVWDWYGFYPSEVNPSWLASDMQDRVIRGDAWDTDGDHARCTFRSWFNPARSHDSIGFRCVLGPRTES